MEVIIICGLIVFLIFGLTAFIGAPYVPTRHADIQRLLRDELKLDKDDIVLDVGSGDGAVLQEVAKTGAQAIGYEINPFLVLASRWRLRKHAKNVRIKWTNAWTTQPAKRITVIYAFGAGLHLKKIYQLARQQATYQGRSVRLVSYGYKLDTTRDDRLLKEAGPYFLYEIRPDFTGGKA
jgi:protein FAM173B